jgi:VanZ family protein
MGILLIMIYALLDEYHQSFVPSRTASIYDSLIDVVGGLTALSIFAIWGARGRQKWRRTR